MVKMDVGKLIKYLIVDRVVLNLIMLNIHSLTTNKDTNTLISHGTFYLH